MSRNQGFDEVMIVNPFDPVLGSSQGVMAMRFGYGEFPEVGYYAEPQIAYAEPPDVGWYAEDPYAEDPYGYFAEDVPLGYYAEDPYGEDVYGYAEDPYGEDPYGEDVYGWYGEDPYGQDPYGWYGQDPYGEDVYGWYGEDPYGQDPYGWYAEDPYGEDLYGEDPYGWYGEDPYGEVPEMVGYGDYGGYVRDVPSPFNAGCPMPTGVAGLGEMEGYVKPGDVSPTCSAFTPQPGGTGTVPETFRPLW